MINLNIKIDDDVHRQLKILAAKKGTTLRIIVNEILLKETKKSRENNANN